MLIYDNCSDNELRKFCRQRSIRLLRSSASRDGMIASLERADDEGATFARFLDLPTELQLRVYDFYKSSLGSRFGAFSVAPPITAVSKLVRHDTASVFFRDRLFICSFKSNGDSARPTPYMEEVTRRFFDKAPIPFLEQVRRLEIMAPLPKPFAERPADSSYWRRPDNSLVFLQNRPWNWNADGYAEWLIDLSAKSRETRVVFESMGPGQSSQGHDSAIDAVKEHLQDVVDAIIARERLALRREDADAILAALGTLPSDLIKG